MSNSLLDSITDLRDVVAILDDENVTGDTRADARAIVAAFIAERLVMDEDDFRDYADDETTLIADNYFQTYAQELAEDLGLINPDATWPNDCIDWKHATRELLYDYSGVDIDGSRYWIRSI